MTDSDVTWTEPGRDSRDSMPIGNGEVGANVWVESNGDVCFYVARTDAWSENCRLLKLGRVRVSFDAGLSGSERFEQSLRPAEGTVTVSMGSGADRRDVTVYADAEDDAIRVDAESGSPSELTVELERWRTESRAIPRDQKRSKEIHSASGLQDSPRPVVVTSDDVVQSEDGIVWYHRNGGSIYRRNLRLQGLGSRAETDSDPLLGRTFGGIVDGDGFVRADETTLVSEAPRRSHNVSVCTHTARTEQIGEWLEAVVDRGETSAAVDPERALERTRSFWADVSERSYIRVSGTEGAETASRGYALQRFMTVAAGRGSYPIKFNGSLFTADWRVSGESFDPDYRRWGGHYWFQNTRLAYWPMLVAGDFECLDPLFEMYREALPLARDRTRAYYGHEGAFFPETMTFWGTYLEDNYGRDRDGREPGEVENDFIRYYWQGGLELVTLGLDRYAFDRDDQFRDETLLPLADAVLAFYDEHYPREDGTIRIEPANALETWWDVVDPLPEIAGLAAVLDRLLALCSEHVDADSRRRWERLRDALPPVPTEERGGRTVLAPAAEYGSERQNLENPELYAVFPYRRYQVGKPDLELARATFRERENTDHGGWHQDPIQAAMLGLTDTAREMVVDLFGDHYDDARFPAFWGPNYDWIPDQDHGGVAALALQRMVLQYGDDEVRLFPAWPSEWDVDFRVHAPRGTTIDGAYSDGEVVSLSVTPSSRRGDVHVMQPD